MISRRHLGALGLLFSASACVSSRLELGADHPANPKARTKPLELASLLGDAPAPPRPAPEPAAHQHDHHHHHASPSADTYTCPMHPEVERSAPGKCPICGMNLVKKSTPAPQGTP